MQPLQFLDASVDPSLALAGSYNAGLVFVSVLIASIVSYSAFGLAERIQSSKAVSTRRVCLVNGAVAMGPGVCAMHWIGMLALRLPIPVGYDVSFRRFPRSWPGAWCCMGSTGAPALYSSSDRPEE